MVHGVRAAMQSLKVTGTDWSTAKGMDPKKFFEVMGMSQVLRYYLLSTHKAILGLNEVVTLDASAGGSAFQVV